VIDKLQFLLALARTRHFGQAAQACGVTQPTLSSGIKQFEEMLGIVLVNRGSRFHSFTPEGERILEWARRIVGDASALKQEVQALKHGLNGHLRIAAVPPALAMVAQLTVPYHVRHPGVSFTVLTRTSTQIEGLFENLEIDAALTYVGNEANGRLRSVPLYREQYRLLTAKESPLAGRAEVSWAEVGQVPLCLLTPDTQNRRIIDGYLEAAGATASPRLVSDSMIVLFAHVRSGHWSTVMPAGLAEALGLADQVSVVPIAGHEPSPTISLVVPRREPLAPLTAALVVEARRLSEQHYR
jgi:DNA-binding transcriptional LysR family regulator